MRACGRQACEITSEGWLDPFQPLGVWIQTGDRGGKALFLGLESSGPATSKAGCNFIFKSPCQGACLIGRLLAGAALNKQAVSFSLPGRYRGAEGVGRAEGSVAERMTPVEERKGPGRGPSG